MAGSSNQPVPGWGATGRWFNDTRWDVVWAAAGDTSPEAIAAREYLSGAYWGPVYTYLRRCGCAPHDAQDLAQEVMARIFNKKLLARLSHQDGKFRSFVLKVAKNSLREQRAHDRADKRGGGCSVISVDACQAEEQIASGFSNELTPDQAFDLRWRQAVMDDALVRVRKWYVKRQKEALFDELIASDAAPARRSDREIAAALNLSPKAVVNARRRLKQRYMQAVCKVIADTVRNPSEVKDEIRYLQDLLGKQPV